MGGRNTVEDAVDFVDRNEMTTPVMLWDESLDSWADYDVTGQPFFVLLDAEGNELGRWREMSPEIDELIG